MVDIRRPVSRPAMIAFGGDFIPPSTVGRPVVKSADLAGLLRSCDLVAVNLECPLTAADSAKTRFTSLYADPASLGEFREFNISLVTLANNHIMDRGLAGLEDTLAALDAGGIPRIGAGRDIDEACRPFLWEGPEVRIAILALGYESPNAPSTAGPGSAGACPLIMSRVKETIAALKRQGYSVCVSYHGGEEFFRTPAPKRRALFHEFAASGASLVVGHHAHVFQGIEIVDQTLIAYGLGNFVMTTPYQVTFKGTSTGLVIVVGFDASGPFAWTTRFIDNRRRLGTVELAHGRRDEELGRLLESSSAALKDPRLYAREWRRDCFRLQWRMNETAKLDPIRRAYWAARYGRVALRKPGLREPGSSIGEGWRYESSDSELMRAALRGSGDSLVHFRELKDCYRIYETDGGVPNISDAR